MKNELIVYRTGDGKTEVQLKTADGSVWLTQLEMAELFDTTKQNVSLHIQNIVDEGELPEATVKESLTVQTEGTRQVQRKTLLYNLAMILAVGYRVRSPRGTQFRQWATRHLEEYLQKGFLMDDERLKNPGGWNYFDELLERIREIRASEKRFYQKVRDLFTLSVDYADDPRNAHLFFAKTQNKLLFAVTGYTAADLVVARADADSPNMALCPTLHRAFDRGLVAIEPDHFTVLVSDRLSEPVESVYSIRQFQGQEIQRPSDERWWLGRENLACHLERFAENF